MSLSIGRRNSVGIAKESSRGTGVNPTYWLNILSMSFKDVPTRARSEAAFGGIWGGDSAPLTMIHGEGEIEAELGSESFGLILLALLGTVVTTGPADTVVYTHTYTLQNDNQHDSLSVGVADHIGELMYRLAMIDTLTLTIVPDKIVSYTMSLLSKGSADWNLPAASYTVEKKFVGRNLTFKVAATTADLAAATAVSLKSLTLTFEKNAEVQRTLSTLHPEDVANKLFTIRGTIELNYENRTWLGYLTDGSYKAVRIDLTGTSLLTGAASTYPEFTIDLSKVDFENWEPDMAMNDIMTQSIDFVALYDAGGNNNVINSCVLKNLVASY